ncbi:MAG: ABC transporter permease [Nocardioidaceae bacterium]
MLAYAIRRFVIGIVVLFVSTFVIFVMVSLSGDPLGPIKAKTPKPPPSVIHAEALRLHLDQSIPHRYWTWLTGIFHGDFGPSVAKNLHIGPVLMDRAVVTLRLIALAMVVALILAVIVGVISAVKQYTPTDYSFTFVGFLFLAMPSFWLAILLKQGGIAFNSATGSQTFFTIGDSSVSVAGGTGAHIVDILEHMILPTISLALISFAAWSRYTRGSMLEVMNSDYVRLARAKGLSRSRVLIKHGLRNALIPLTTVTALDIGAIIGGAVITESVFQWHGMGDFLIQRLRHFDAYAVTGWLLLAATVVIVFNIIADLLYAVLDPRIRYA